MVIAALLSEDGFSKLCFGNIGNCFCNISKTTVAKTIGFITSPARNAQAIGFTTFPPTNAVAKSFAKSFDCRYF